ncbi:hypothetical protein AS034_14970 [[Bacillus] enclensis]|jgi:Protein of unknown function (DUF4257)|uniref:DUF4257 domain-containing protein n=2 Tax=Rossellomorea TaxID=2837508 RepID=A0A1J6VWL2_9BACI|nr:MULTISPECIES: DUF4257 domain-containing protein [Rossellomorea]KSU61632.1 hypothetical protein AS034_14970 [[Bacillus] enclensis]OIU70238.1 hypothetical protein BHE18_10950 [Rossellomorea aquimaris]SCC19885.1 Protein of unknown function [[Bacillus] enclensis]
MSLIEVILLPMLMGGIGGLGHILIFKNGHFTFPRKFIDDQGEKHYLFGSTKDIIIGVLAGYLSVLPVIDTIPMWYAIYISLLSGIGGSSVITRKMEQSLATTKESYIQELSQYQLELTSKGGSSNHNEVKPVGKVEEKKNQG